jgi:hypothetical protein
MPKPQIDVERMDRLEKMMEQMLVLLQEINSKLPIVPWAAPVPQIPPKPPLGWGPITPWVPADIAPRWDDHTTAPNWINVTTSADAEKYTVVSLTDDVE